MDINKAAVAFVVALCVGAGAGGAYFASRGNDGRSDAPSAQVPSSAAAGALAVYQSEGIVDNVPTPAPVQPRLTPGTRAVTARPVAAPVPPPAMNPPRSEPVAPAESVAAIPSSAEPARAFEPETARAPEPPAPQFEELVVAADSVIGLQVETALSSDAARVEDDVVARVTRDVRVDGRVAIPAGSRAEGEVTLVERGGKLRERARLGVRFTSVVLADGTRVALDTETIYREGSSPGGESAAKIGGGAIGGAIIGGILGGAKGAMIGGSIGAGAGTAATMAGGRNAATLPSGTPVTVRVTRPVAVPVDR